MAADTAAALLRSAVDTSAAVTQSVATIYSLEKERAVQAAAERGSISAVARLGQATIASLVAIAVSVVATYASRWSNRDQEKPN